MSMDECQYHLFTQKYKNTKKKKNVFSLKENDGNFNEKLSEPG